MRLFLTTLFYVFLGMAFSQNNVLAQERGVKTVAATEEKTTGTIRAVVVGISDYQDEEISDLQFAHKDAEAFAAYLQSPSGGNVLPENLKLFTNEKATQARVAIELNNLVEQSEQGDRIIIYFGGHGDVEKNIILQPGYLLCYDAPAKVYYSGGTLDINLLQLIISTLSIEKNIQVLLVTDACHSGKLAGNHIGGTQLTANQLKERFANERMILSCQPNEYSIEGEQWGGGRGVFSYHLVNGLYGMADSDGNMEVKLKEIRRYLEDHVPADANPHQQNPVVNGDVESFLSHVDPSFLESFDKMEAPVFTAGGSRNLFENEDTTIQQLYLAFEQSIADGNLLYPEGASAEHYYQQLLQKDSIREQHGLLTRNFAAALQDEAQQAINDYIRSERFAVEFMHQPDLLDFYKYPEYMERSAELLGPDHILYNQTKAKEFFFRARNLMIEDYLGRSVVSPAVQQRLFCEYCNEGLEYMPQAPFLLAMLGHGRCNNRAVDNYREAVDLSPTWLQAYIWIAEELERQGALGEADSVVSQIFVLDSAYVLGHRKQCQLQVLLGNYEGAVRAGEDAMEFDTSVLDPWYNDWLPAAYVLTHRYGKFRDYRKRQAEELQGRVGGQLDDAQRAIDLANYYFEATESDLAKALYGKVLESSSQPELLERANWGMGWVALANGDLAEAENWFMKMSGMEKMTGLGLAHWNGTEMTAADSFFREAIGQYLENGEKALPTVESIIVEGNTVLAIAPGLARGIGRVYELALEKFPDDPSLDYHLGRIYLDQLGKKRKAIRFFEKTLEKDKGYVVAYIAIAIAHARSGRDRKCLLWIEEALKNGLNDIAILLEEPSFGNLRRRAMFNELIQSYPIDGQ